MPAARLALALALAAAAPPPPPSFSEELWFMNERTAAESLFDPFVLALGAGALPRAAFATYVAQDAAFLEAFADAYAKAREKCASEGALRDRCEADLTELRSAVKDELQLHAAYAAKWGASLGKGFAPLAATTAYTTFLDDVASDEAASAAEVVAAMVPCMALYAELGRRLDEVGAGVETNPYGEWVRTYASDDFWAARRRAEGLLDALANAATAANDPAKLRRAPALYAEAMRLEAGFFAAQDVPPTADGAVAAFRRRIEARRGGGFEL